MSTAQAPVRPVGGVPAPGGASHQPHRSHRPRRTELARFLRARREQLSPRDVGLPPGPRRRTPGLRREELALLAGVGITWYTWLEQGRPINVSTQVLDAVARALRLDQAARLHLYRLAEATRVGGRASRPDVPAAVRDILAALEPNPAILVNGRFDILVSNYGHQVVFADWHSMPCIHRNLIWCAVTEPTAREKFLNYDDEVPYLVARMRADYAAHVGDPEWDEDIRRLSELSPEFASLWARHEVAAASPRLRIFRDAAVGELRFISTELDVSAVPGLRIIAYSPDDEPTRSCLPGLCERPLA